MKNSDKAFNELSALREHFHSNPELSGHEVHTREYINEFIMSKTEKTKIIMNNQRGLIAVKGTADNSMTIAFRAEMDALPIKDSKEVSYRSRVDGISHACGHDVHMAILLYLLKELDFIPLNINIVYIFQSSEEVYNGAIYLVERLKQMNIDMLFALHVAPDIPAGTFSLNNRPFLAENFTGEIKIKLHQGHVTEQNNFMHVLTFLDNWMNSYNSDIKFCKISHVETDGYYNIMPSFLKLYMSFRGYHDSVCSRDFHDLCKVLNEREDIENVEYCSVVNIPMLKNDYKAFNFVRAVLQRKFGSSNVWECPPLMSSDDFAIYANEMTETRCCYFFLGGYLEENMVNAK